ncbi:MAG: hypothetical protein NDI61_05300 [Bdellovibrionaceae bacterium]|nr:hypothetical protein [Pseudobdellovibrionaceae bacterium]
MKVINKNKKGLIWKWVVSLTVLMGMTGVAQAGAETPSGAHYNLNIIGVPKSKTAAMTGNNGGRIFVPLYGKSKIELAEGSTFQVLDANATDGSARFQLPNPDPDNDGLTEYSVFARALGKPGGQAQMVTCATDPLTLEEVCSTLSSVFVRSKGRSSWDNVTQELLYIYYDLDGDGVVERYPLFDDRLQDYFWSYDNAGLKLLQLRFYEVVTDVN